MEFVAQEVERQAEEVIDNTVARAESHDMEEEGIHEFNEEDTMQIENDIPAEGAQHFVDEPQEDVDISPSKSPSQRRSYNPDGTSRRVASPSIDLMRTTKSRVNDSQQLEHQRRMKEGTRIKVASSTYQPSDSLLRTTQSRIADIKEWEASKDRVNYDDDIWWELRRPTPSSTHKPDVPSKLFQPTEASKSSVRQKKKAERPTSPTKDAHHVSKIDPTSPLLKTTRNMVLSNWNAEKPNQPAPQLHLATAGSGPHVNSKIMDDTTATLQAKWRPKPADPAPIVSPSKNVKPPSDRLVAYNTAMRRQSRDKVRKGPVDPRERGWNLKNLTKDGIPPVEVCFGPPVRRSSTSGSPGRRSLSSSRESCDADYAQAVEEVVAGFDPSEDLQAEELEEAEANLAPDSESQALEVQVLEAQA